MAQKLDPIQEFREDHRKVRDGILDITDALRKKDVKKARQILGHINEFVGPHFRYEEEHLYPALRKLLGEHVDQLLTEHDSVIATAKVCAGLLSKDSLTDAESREAVKAAMDILVHVSNCDGLAILTERFTSGEIDDLGAKFAEARKKGVPLLEWADKIRKH